MRREAGPNRNPLPLAISPPVCPHHVSSTLSALMQRRKRRLSQASSSSSWVLAGESQGRSTASARGPHFGRASAPTPAGPCLQAGQPVMGLPSSCGGCVGLRHRPSKGQEVGKPRSPRALGGTAWNHKSERNRVGCEASQTRALSLQRAGCHHPVLSPFLTPGPQCPSSRHCHGEPREPQIPGVTYPEGHLRTIRPFGALP